MTACPLTAPTRPPLSPEVEDLLELAVYAARSMARQPAACASALEGTLVAAELLTSLGAPVDLHTCGRCEGAGFLILDRVARVTGELIDVECPRCRGTGTVR